MQLEGKKAIVTGGSGAIASATVRAYVKEGAIVSSLDVLDELGEKVVKDANEKGPGKAKYYHCDISNAQEVKSVFEKAIADMGGLDVLANVAAIAARVCNPEDISEEQLDRIIGVDLKGTVFTNQAAFKVMKNTGGAIVNFGSDSAIISTPGVADYAAAKGGVISWTRAIASEWGKYGIRANTVNPSARSPRGREVVPPEVRAAALEALMKMIPLGGKSGDPDKDLAPVMVFLASDASRFITGQIIAVNGGFSMVR